MPDKCVELHIAALKGDCKSMTQYSTDQLRSQITDQGETALHIAAAAKKLPFVETLVNRLKAESGLTPFLETENSNRNTALCYAAVSGNVKIARVMLDAYSNSISTNDACNLLANLGNVKPLLMAAMYGQSDMVKYLFVKTKIKDWSGEERIELFTNCISMGLCGLALVMLKDYGELATARNRKGLHVLAQNPSVFAPRSQPCWKTFIRGAGEDPRMKAVELVKELYHRLINYTDLEESDRVTGIAQELLEAARKGNVDFIIELIRLDPDFVWKFDSIEGTIFHIAVRNRHEDIFSLLPEFGSIQDLIAAKVLDNNRNMLLLAAELAPQAQLNKVSGAALQMQRELLWFKEVEKVMQPSYKEREDKDKKTPRMVFTEKHKDLMAKGEKWMKETAKSSMVVAALIATVVFTAAFTVPGGYNDTTGEPIFKNQTSFIVFASADALALLCATNSILMFHSILTSRYTETEFLNTLPWKFMIGVTALFVSVTALVVTFCVSFLLYYPYDKVPWLLGLLSLFACVPSVYIVVKYALLADLVWYTFASWFMFRPRRQLFPRVSACEPVGTSKKK